MILDFKEISQANLSNGKQDHFELFTRDFLRLNGFEIIRNPDRGADGQKDIIVREKRKGEGGTTIIDWLVSCKHYSFSGKSVTAKDEIDILDRVKSHNCNGFMGFYSTLPHSSLSNKIFGLSEIETLIYDNERIEDILLSKKHNRTLTIRNFPDSSKLFFDNSNLGKNDKLESSNDRYIQNNITAIIIVEIQHIKYKYFDSDWENRNILIDKLRIYNNKINIAISSEVIGFLYDISNHTRANMPLQSAASIYWNLLEFFPNLEDIKNEEERIRILKKCINIGINLTYDAVIHLRNLAIAEKGLSIIKFIYSTIKHYKIEKYNNEIYTAFTELEDHFQRPGRDDLNNSRELLNIFKNDLEEFGISSPPLPKHLSTIVDNEKN